MTGLDQARAALADGTAPLDELARTYDRLLSETVAKHAPEGGWALLALGGYGRREMAPFSDVDVQFIADGEPEWIQHCLHEWWARGLKLGYATRQLDETVELASTDHKTAMSLLDARLVMGEQALLDELLLRLQRRLYQPRRVELLQAILDEREARHSRFGDTVYLLEPDIKSGEGGLRDLHGARWAAALSSGSATLTGSCLTPIEEVELAEAVETLRRFRILLHDVAGRRVSRLHFAYQEALTERLGADDIPSGMQLYWQAAGRVRALTRRILDTIRIELGMPVNPHIAAPDVGPLTPAAALAYFRRSAAEDLPLHPELLRASAYSVNAVDDDVRSDRATIDDFFYVLTHPHDRARPLEHLHDVGLLSALIPEFACIAGLYQHNVFHVYTVDAHTLHGIAELKRLAAGQGPAYPVAIMARMTDSERRVLFLALLLHDIGKGGGEVGAARVRARQLGLTEADSERVAFLVREHLLLALLAQTRDIYDEVTVRHLAREVVDGRTLDMLYLVTWGDMSSANQNLLTGWKAGLLADLHARTEARITGGLGVYADPANVVSARRAEVLERLLGAVPEHPTKQTRAVDHFISGLPTRYSAVTDADTLINHMSMCAELRTQHASMRLDEAADETAIITVCAKDGPGILSRVSGVLAGHGLNILSAEVFSKNDGIVIDVFRVELPVPWDALVGELERAASGELSPEPKLRRRECPSALGEPPAPPVETEVSIDNDASLRFTVIDVVARDRPGLLYRVTRALHRLGLDIGLARITTEGHTARDAFYVEYVTGGKLTDPARIARVIDCVEKAADALL